MAANGFVNPSSEERDVRIDSIKSFLKRAIIPIHTAHLDFGHFLMTAELANYTHILDILEYSKVAHVCILHTPCWNRNLIAPKVPFAPLWILIEEPHSMSGFEY